MPPPPTPNQPPEPTHTHLPSSSRPAALSGPPRHQRRRRLAATAVLTPPQTRRRLPRSRRWASCDARGNAGCRQTRRRACCGGPCKDWKEARGEARLSEGCASLEKRGGLCVWTSCDE
eukprot:366147-Chlamydomonas_euryale.AAC.16